MATGFSGTYRGSVVDDADPSGQSRLRVLVPEVLGDESVWAEPSLSSIASGLPRVPTIGEDVWVSFERGDTDAPVWEAYDVDVEPETSTPGYVGKYRGVVVDDQDPEGAARLLVLVPEVLADTPVWATPSPSAGAGGELRVPAIGEEVWIEFDNGDNAYPAWAGLA